MVRIFSSVLQGLRFISTHANVLIYFNTFHYIPAGAYGVGGGGAGEASPALFRKLQKSALISGKNALILDIYG